MMIQNGSELAGVSTEFNPSEGKLRLIIDSIPVIAWCALADGSLEFWNQRWHDYTGLPKEGARGWSWTAALHPEDLDRIENKWRADIASGHAGEVEGRLRRFDGEYRWFLFRYEPLREEASNIVSWYGTITDIEDLKRAEQKLRESEEEFQRVADLVAQAIVVLSADGNVVYVNRVTLQKTGLTLEEVKAQGCYSSFRDRIVGFAESLAFDPEDVVKARDGYFSSAFHPEDVENLWAKRGAGLSRGEPFELEIRSRRPDGQYQWVLLQYNPFRDDQGNIVRWYVTGTDIQRQKAEQERLRNENVALREEIESSMFEEIVGSSEPMRQVITQVAKVAPSDSTVLILGETGTGKELIARALHRRSDRAAKPFIRVNCAAIPQSLIASELFGHEKGAFTGALQRHIGRFESAHGGTIFLDEVGDLPAETQIALLRVLQEREIERVGSHHPIAIDVRLIAATNRDLSAAIASGEFREDLFYRLNVFPIGLPALRERVADIPLLLEYFVGRYAKKAGKKINHINKHTLGLFKAYDWPGNIRELQNIVERGVILSEDDTFSVDESWFKRKLWETSIAPGGLSGLADREIEMITAALAESQGRIGGPAGAAAKLKIPRQTLESKIRRLGINKHTHKTRSIK
jgi:formate hydrogenlyase transcriptional activator